MSKPFLGRLLLLLMSSLRVFYAHFLYLYLVHPWELYPSDEVGSFWIIHLCYDQFSHLDIILPCQLFLSFRTFSSTRLSTKSMHFINWKILDIFPHILLWLRHISSRHIGLITIIWIILLLFLLIDVITMFFLYLWDYIRSSSFLFLGPFHRFLWLSIQVSEGI